MNNVLGVVQPLGNTFKELEQDECDHGLCGFYYCQCPVILIFANVKRSPPPGPPLQIGEA
jgi:hypothetical protein